MSIRRTNESLDNATARHKISLRRLMLADAAVPARPVVLETHGGAGLLYDACYAHRAAGGVVFEADGQKASLLAQQRPEWSVYEGDCEAALAAGAAAHLAFDVVDVDPYGSPFETIGGLFKAEGRTWPDVVQLVVNDGLRQKVRFGGAWDVICLRPIVAEWGNDLFDRYIDVAKEMVARLVAPAGFGVARWRGYHCGTGEQMTHYWAELRREPRAEN